MKSDLIGPGKVHFIGIGGAGMSAIAKVLLEMGAKVSGSDLKESRYTRALREIGAEVFIGHDPSNTPDSGTVVISSAIPDYNPELKEAKKKDLKIVRRAEMLAEICRGKPRSIAVAGTHGKTTTTSMIALILERAGLEPTFLVGGELNDIGSNAKNGAGDICLVEADESDGSLVHLAPTIAAITNIDRDHLEHYKNLNNIIKLFTGWIKSLGPDATVIALGDGSTAAKAVEDAGRAYVSFGTGRENDISLIDTDFEGLGTSSTVIERSTGSKIDLRLQVPGIHNVYNAMAALCAAKAGGVDTAAAAGMLADFRGAKRRFQVVAKKSDIWIIDDYAHHPAEVKATIGAAEKVGRSRVICVYQPHRFSRTQMLSRDFGTVFSGADQTILTNIYNAGEEPIPGVSGKLLVDEILSSRPRSRVTYIPDKMEIADYLDDKIRPGDIVLTMGAGDIGSVGYELARRIKERC